MWPLPRPLSTASEALRACLARMRNVALRDKLASGAPDVEAAATAFDVAAARGMLHEYPQHRVFGPGITAEEMKSLYDGRMARRGSAGRAIYDAILSAPPHGRCPLCGQRQVGTLDHQLPKAHYPVLAVTPLNLVPACAECNKAKLDAVPRRAEEVYLHPYYEAVDQERWLVADVVQSRPAVTLFRVDAPASWTDVLRIRVERQFDALGLGSLYTSQAAEELLNARHQLAGILEGSGPAVVRSELEGRAVSCREARLNSWHTACYEAWVSVL